MEGGTERRRGGRRSALPRGDQEDGAVAKRERREPNRRDGSRDQEDRAGQFDQEHKPRSDQDSQESDSLIALKGILAKVASLLKPLQLTAEEAIGLVEQLYGRGLETEAKLAGETDDARKSSVLSHIQETVIRREGDALVIEYPEEE